MRRTRYPSSIVRMALAWLMALAVAVPLAGCSRGGVGSVDFDGPPNVQAIGGSPKAKARAPRQSGRPSRRPIGGVVPG